MTDAPFPLLWRDGAFWPATPYQATRCAEHFEIGGKYALIEYQPRNMPRHAALFAQLDEVWEQLPEGMADDFPTQDHLRAFALIKTGWHDRTSYILKDADEALKLAGDLRRRSQFSLVVVSGATVDFYEPKSQAVRAMKDPEFVKSMNDVLDYAANLVGIDRNTLKENAGQAA